MTHEDIRRLGIVAEISRGRATVSFSPAQHVSAVAPQPEPRCHAGASHRQAVAFGAAGALCWTCYERHRRWLARLLGRP